jgi:hypothetical protein
MELTWVLLPDRYRYSLLSLYLHLPFVTFWDNGCFFNFLISLFWQVWPYVYETTFYFRVTFKLVEFKTEPLLLWWCLLEDKSLQILFYHSMNGFYVFEVFDRTLSDLIHFFLLFLTLKYNHIIFFWLILILKSKNTKGNGIKLIILNSMQIFLIRILLKNIYTLILK